MTLHQSRLSHPKYRPDIDGLRAFAVLSVVIFHAFPSSVKGGFIGVDVFFVISGYLISTIIFENLDKGTFSFFEFYSRRIRRIFPALLLVLIVCFSFGWFVLLADEYRQLGKHIAGGAGFVSNFVLWNEAGYFDNSAETKPLLHLWSLGIEEQFYIVWPLLIWFAWKRKFNLLTITIFAAIATFILNLKGVKQDMVATFYSPQTRFWELLSGSLLAWFTLYKKGAFTGIKSEIGVWLSRFVRSEKQEGDGKILANALSFIGLFLLLCGFWRINKELSFPGKWALVPVLSAVLIIAAGSKAWVNRAILSNKLVVWFGLISFPLYLWHWPILSFARIIESEVPSRNIRIAAVVLSILLAWLTYKLVERPIRSGNAKNNLKIIFLCGAIFVIGVFGFVVSRADFSESRGYEKLAIRRKGFEHAFGSSLSWYRGKNDWLFLGNEHNNSVAKLKLSIEPSIKDLDSFYEQFSKIANVAAKYNTKVALIIGPNKSTIYPENLPDELKPSSVRYISFFLDRFKNIPNFIAYDPTEELLKAKKENAKLYWTTDSHWNSRGAFFAYKGFADIFSLPVPQVEFKLGANRKVDLIEISKLQHFPISSDDSWEAIFNAKPQIKETVFVKNKRKEFAISLVKNSDYLLNQNVWIVGDSFSLELRQYFNATFREVYYAGHFIEKMQNLSDQLEKANKKPDMIIIVRVERGF